MGYNGWKHDAFIDFKYHAPLCEGEGRFARAIKKVPPTCDVCEHGCIRPDESSAVCEASGERVESRGWDGPRCANLDNFEPTREWEEALKAMAA